MKQRQTLQLALASIALLGLLAACSHQEAQSGTSDLSSRDITSTPTKPLANCNSVTMSKLKFNAMIYRDSASTVRYDLIQGKIQNMTENFRTHSGDYVRFFRWKIDSNGSYYLDPTPIQVRVFPEGSSIPITDYQNFLSWDLVSAYANSISSTSAADFFTRVRLLMDIRDANADYDAIMIAYYQASDTSTPIEQADFLIPTFYANPADYATDPMGYARPTALQNLHPFKSQTDLTANAYQTMANNYCF